MNNVSHYVLYYFVHNNQVSTVKFCIYSEQLKFRSCCPVLVDWYLNIYKFLTVEENKFLYYHFTNIYIFLFLYFYGKLWLMLERSAKFNCLHIIPNIFRLKLLLSHIQWLISVHIESRSDYGKIHFILIPFQW